jgi:hypothetical protein
VARPLLAEVGATAHVIDLGGQPPTTGWTGLERTQNALTNLQQTGQLRGITKRTFAVEAVDEGKEAPKPEPVRDVTVALDGDTLTIHAGARTAAVALAGAGGPVPAWIRTEAPELARPGNVATWAVDRVRTEVGDDAMQVVKAVAFTALDFILRHKESVTGDTGAEDIAKDLGKSELDPPVRSIPSDPEIGWPPAPLEPWVIPALPGEGQWNTRASPPPSSPPSSAPIATARRRAPTSPSGTRGRSSCT